MSARATILCCLLSILAFPMGCTVMKARASSPITTAAPVVVPAAEIRAHWTKTGEPAPFDGVLLSKAAYAGLREKITRLEGAVASCRNEAH